MGHKEQVEKLAAWFSGDREVRRESLARMQDILEKAADNISLRSTLDLFYSPSRHGGALVGEYWDFTFKQMLRDPWIYKVKDENTSKRGVLSLQGKTDRQVEEWITKFVM